MKKFAVSLLCGILFPISAVQACTAAAKSFGSEAWIVGTVDYGNTPREIEKVSGLFSKYSFFGVRNKSGGESNCGVNTAGLFIKALSSPLQNSFKKPVMQILLKYGSVAEVLESKQKLFEDYPSYIFLIADKHQTAIIEIGSQGKVYSREGDVNWCANDYQVIREARRGTGSFYRQTHAENTIKTVKSYEKLIDEFYADPVVNKKTDAMLSVYITDNCVELIAVLDPNSSNKKTVRHTFEIKK